MSVIEIHHLTKDYGNHKGIFDVSFSIERGEVFGFLGPNGAGKTTTIRHLMGFIRPQKGTCSIDGLDCLRQAAKIQNFLGYLPGEIAYMDEMTGSRFLKFIASYRGLKDMRNTHQLLERFELDPKGKIKKMSKGMKQKIGLVCAFMHDPEILILDEPTSGLDPLMQKRFVELILEEKERGKTILMSSHMIEEIELTCDRIAMIKGGSILAIDNKETLKRQRKRLYRVTLSNAADAKAFVQEKAIEVDTIHRNEVTVTTSDLNGLIAILHRYPLHDLVSADQSLEEIFLQYYGGDLHA